jgi:hypothetical protein
MDGDTSKAPPLARTTMALNASSTLRMYTKPTRLNKGSLFKYVTQAQPICDLHMAASTSGARKSVPAMPSIAMDGHINGDRKSVVRIEVFLPPTGQEGGDGRFVVSNIDTAEVVEDGVFPAAFSYIVEEESHYGLDHMFIFAGPLFIHSDSLLEIATVDEEAFQRFDAFLRDHGGLRREQSPGETPEDSEED